MVEVGIHFSCSSTTGQGWPELYREAIGQAQLGERQGFSCALVAEHHFTEDGWIPSPLVLCGALAAVTSDMLIGPDVVILPLNHPIRIAEDLAVLDNLTNGRAVCVGGLGAQKSEFARYGVPFRQRVSRSEEALEVVRRLLEERDVTFEGRYITFESTTVTPRPVQSPRPAVWYGAIAPPGARRAARYADGLVIGPTPDLELAEEMANIYRQEREEAGLDPSGGRVVLRREAFVSEDRHEAWTHGADAVKYQYSRVYGNLPPDISDAAFREYAHNRFLIGSPAEVLEQMWRFVQATRTNLFVLRLQLPGLDGPTVDSVITTIGEKVIPELART
jgi:alkanesulfonate monooxygenase SsuD/methylene tetrahydromethanopterin reductase-like flavin-dependent oxidoreductase (luciferase family)